MSQLITYNTVDYFKRNLFSIYIHSLPEIPVLSLNSKKFTCLVACDVSNISEENLEIFATNLIDQGAVYVCAWGPDCDRMEKAVDLAHVIKDIGKEIESPVIMTTSHHDEEIDEALWFLLGLAAPDDAYFKECESSLVIVVDNEEWNSHVQSRLSNPQSLNTDN